MDYLSIQNNCLCGNITDEEARVLMEKTMKLAQIEKNYQKQIKQLPDGRWWIRLEGKVIKKKSIESVYEEIYKTQNQKVELELVSVAEKWLKVRQATRAAGTWSKDFRFIKNYLKGSPLEHMKIDKIVYSNTVEWAKWCLKKNPKMKEKYFKNIKGELSRLFEFSLKEGIVSMNPAKDLSLHTDNFVPPTKHEDSDLIFSDEEKENVKKLIFDEAEKTGDTVCLGLVLLFNTGIRDGELNELRWKDIENDSYLHIQRELVEDHDPETNKLCGYKVVDHCKSKAGNRRIPLNLEALKVLELQKQLSIENGYLVGKDDLIFRRDRKEKGLQCNTRCYEPRIKRFCRLANMDVLKSQHDIRRTFCTNMYYSGVPLKNLQKLMGHSSLKQTMDYIKFKEDDKDELLEYLNMI